MMVKMLRKLLKLDENDRAIEECHNKVRKEVKAAVVALKKSGELERKLVKKTTTYYIARGVGVIQ